MNKVFELCGSCQIERPTYQTERDGVTLICCGYCNFVIRTMDKSRHTAIPCAHSLPQIREKVEKILRAYVMPNSAYIRLSSEITAEINLIMLDHAEEIATEYRTIIKRIEK